MQQQIQLQPTPASSSSSFSSSFSSSKINNNANSNNKQTSNINSANTNNKAAALSVEPTKSWMDEAGDEISNGADAVGAAVSKTVNDAADAILPTQPVDTTLANDQPTHLLIPFGYLTLLCILLVGFLLGSAFGIFFHFHWTKYYTESGRIMTTNSAREALIRDSRYQTLEQSGGGKYNFSQCKLM